MDEITFDSAGLDALTRDLEESIRRFGPEMDRTLLKVGGTVAEAAKKVAEQAGSESIPPTIRVLPGRETVAVRAGNEKVQLAVLWEKGNKGASKRKQFWHPVYGHRKPGALQDRHPFLKKARTLCRRPINELMNATYDRVLEPIRRGGRSE